MGYGASARGRLSSSSAISEVVSTAGRARAKVRRVSSRVRRKTLVCMIVCFYPLFEEEDSFFLFLVSLVWFFVLWRRELDCLWRGKETVERGPFIEEGTS